MIEFEVSNKVFGEVLKALSLLVSEARFHFNEFGMRVTAVDVANVALVIAKIPVENFERYSIDEDEVTIGLDINRFYEASKTMGSKEFVKFTADNSVGKLSNGKIEYSCALIEPSAIRKEPKIPELNLPAKIVFDAGEFKKAIDVVDKISDIAVFESDEESFRIHSSDSIESVKFEMTEGELIEFNGAEARSMFSVEYLKLFSKVAKNGNLLTVKLGTNMPVWLVFENSYTVEFILAPRIEAT